ncbi:uncharacterized protein CLUP02_11517 [Colletotrichum lupini]|uniref:Uncharacterized protein n=1 Tax=Colletotrichum lupini TaxID=145971 RepID=A0A9Q8WJK0_9PEZI|nr:uncharacterized protein CLUP02_11517 [Colletotrichum lupini]UQC86018.1 hypothetical protein CLUP02_11517 [Colletotrichum lupini]
MNFPYNDMNFVKRSHFSLNSNQLSIFQCAWHRCARHQRLIMSAVTWLIQSTRAGKANAFWSCLSFVKLRSAFHRRHIKPIHPPSISTPNPPPSLRPPTLDKPNFHTK